MRAGLIIAAALLLSLAACRLTPHPDSGWGLNPGSSWPGKTGEPPRLAAPLSSSGIAYLREEVPPGGAPPFRPPGIKILGLVPYSFGLSPENAADLRVVYAAARRLGAREGKSVNAWENRNEPDVGFDPDPPDRSVAFMKAVYLGLKDSALPPPPVLLPALGLPPGPWLDRAERNGLPAYGDALNFHYYSRAEDFPDEIRLLGKVQEKWLAARQVRQALPVWVTEIGLDCAPRDQPDDATGRNRQADFFRETARDAAGAGLAAFMPYAYRDSEEGFSLANAAQKPYIAWNVYAEATRSLALDAQPKWIDQGSAAPRVILQWLPDDATCHPHKVSGTYRFIDRATPMTGRVRIYSFADRPVHGMLDVDLNPSDGIRAKWIAPPGMQPEAFAARTPFMDGWQFDLQPGEVKEVQLILTPPTRGYAAGWIAARFDQSSAPAQPPSLLYFGCETEPRDRDFTALPCRLDAPAMTTTGEDFHAIDGPLPPAISSRAGPWLALNGLQVDAAADRTGNAAWNFQLDQPSMKPGEPPMAVARISQLPGAGFLRLTTDHPLGGDVSLRVDLVDDQGQRFSIFENGGLDPGQVSDRLWLNLADFHRYFWGRFLPGKDFDPKNVREVQLRFYFKFLHDPVRIGLETLQPRLSAK
jgi:hypothetical protein